MCCSYDSQCYLRHLIFSCFLTKFSSVLAGLILVYYLKKRPQGFFSSYYFSSFLLAFLFNFSFSQHCSNEQTQPRETGFFFFLRKHNLKCQRPLHLRTQRSFNTQPATRTYIRYNIKINYISFQVVRVSAAQVTICPVEFVCIQGKRVFSSKLT